MDGSYRNLVCRRKSIALCRIIVEELAKMCYNAETNVIRYDHDHNETADRQPGEASAFVSGTAP